MHFAGVYVRRKDQSCDWHSLLATATKAIAPHALLEVFSAGAVAIAADTRVTRVSSNIPGVLVNSGSLIPAADMPVTLALTATPNLAACLMRCRGNFAGSFTPKDGSSVTLFSDFLGTHPVYYASLPEAFVFSTSQRLLERLLRRRLTIDMEGLLETCTFGFPFADRTTFKEIRCIEAAQIITADAGTVTATPYWGWRDLDTPIEKDLDVLADRTYATFREAVARRQQPNAYEYTLLSGGMDSRAIAATQVALGKRPKTVSFSHERALDAVLARQAAGALGCEFNFYPMSHSAFSSCGGVAQLVHDMLLNTPSRNPNTARIWSGDGGSVGLGAVYLSDGVLAHAARGDASAAAATFLQSNRLSSPSRALFRSAIDVEDFALRAVLREFNRFTGSRRTQIPYRFLLLNDQRRHLHYTFELPMASPFEFLTPFWDSEFMRIVMQCPDTQLLYHEFYSRFFLRLPPLAASTPWQTYPDHAACPLPLPGGYDYNWDHPSRPADIAEVHKRARDILRASLARSFPSTILRRSTVALAACAVLGTRATERAYLLRQAESVLGSTRTAAASH